MKRVGGWLGRLLLWWLLWETALRLWLKLRPGHRLIGHTWSPAWLLRRLFWPPERLVSRLGVKPGMCVVEMNAGAGQLTLPLAYAIGPSGQLIVTDEHTQVVEKIQMLALERGLHHVVALRATPTTLPAEAVGCDLIVMTTTFGGALDKQAVAEEAYRALRPGGALAVTELLVDSDYALASTVVTHLVLAGFGIECEIGNFAGYTVIARK